MMLVCAYAADGTALFNFCSVKYRLGGGCVTVIRRSASLIALSEDFTAVIFVP